MPTQVTAFGTTPEGEFYVVNDLPGGLHRVSFERVEPTCGIGIRTNAWGTGMTVDLTITNTGTTPINGWTLEFPLPYGQSIVSDWNTTVSRSGDIITAASAGHNAAIPPGATVTLGYLAGHTGNPAAPGRFALNESTCSHGG
jgi:cellulase/cellobiase CelA1